MHNADVAAAREYHERTKHSVARVRAGGHFLDWDIRPLPFKVYETLVPIPLATDLPSLDVPALDAVVAAPRLGADARGPDAASLALLLHYGAGIVKRKAYPGGEILFRAAACTGALYHIDLYLVCGDLPDLEAGVYHFGPHDHALRRLRRGDYRGVVVSATAAEPATAAAPAVLVCTSTFWRNSWKYRARTYRHCFWDCGTLLANVLAVAHALALPARVVLGFADAPINRLLDLDTAREVALVLLPLGRGAIVSPDDRPLEPLGLPVRPLSSAEVDYPEIRRIHDASCLSVGEVAAWRARTPAARSEPALHALPRAPRSGLPVDRAILRRSSTRRFAREALSLSALTTMLDAATRGIPTDYTDGDRLALGGLYLIANAVDGLSPGAYAFDHRRGTMEPLREGPLRRDAGHLALGQELAQEASVNVYVLTGLEPVLARYGNRGYRAAQLEGGIAGGKLYLAAAALGIGATGLTFFDDDVTAFFSPHAAGRSVMFLTALGRPASRSRR